MTSLVISDLHTVSLALPPDMAFDDWLTLGRDLNRQNRSLKWMMGDWLAYGRARPDFTEQLALALPTITDDPKALENAAKVAKEFPADLRDDALTFEHYRHLSDLPHGQARQVLLDKVTSDRLSVRATEKAVIAARATLGDIAERIRQITPQAQDDADLTAIIRMWNRASVNVREDFAAMIEEAGTGEIEP